MSWTLIAHTSIAGGTTGAINTTGADLIIVCGCTFNGSGTVSDSASNSWTTATSDNTGFAVTIMSYVHAPTTSASHTFSLTGTAPSITVLAYSGSAATPLDQTNHAATTATTIQAGSITPGANGELIVAFCGADANISSVDSSLTIQDNIAFNSGVAEAAADATFIQNTAAAINPTWTLSASTATSALIASFKVAAAAAPTFIPYRLKHRPVRRPKKVYRRVKIASVIGARYFLNPPSQAWVWNPQTPLVNLRLGTVSKAWVWAGNAPPIGLALGTVSKAWIWTKNASLLSLSLGMVSKSWSWFARGPTLNLPQTVKQAFNIARGVVWGVIRGVLNRPRIGP